MSMRDLARELNSSASRINDLEKGRTKLNDDWRRRLAKVFDVLPSQIAPLDPDANDILRDDVEEFEDDVSNEIRLTESQKLYVVKSDALDQLGLFPNTILVVDTSKDVIANIISGDVAVVNWYDNSETRILLRQYIPPSILITNSSTQRLPTINLRTQDVGIRGLVVAAHKRFR